MNIFKLIGQIFKPAAELVDSLHTSEEEKLQQKAVLLDLQTRFLQEGLQFEQEQMKLKADIIMTEAKSESWLTRNWRPLTMVALIASVLAFWFGLTPTDPSTGLSIIPAAFVERMFSLVQIGLGGYIVGRSGEKITKGIVTAFKNREET
jgi:hypothetical protein